MTTRSRRERSAGSGRPISRVHNAQMNALKQSNSYLIPDDLNTTDTRRLE